MAVNKIVYNGTTLVDLTGDTVTAEVLKSGYTAHQADGEPITGGLESVPAGGMAGQVLTKRSDTDFDTGWEDNIPVSNPNLLDNWYFIHPINQRGETAYGALTYTIDRWRSEGNTVMTVNTDSISMKDSKIFQLIEIDFESFKNRPLTVSVLTKEGNLYTSSGVFPSGDTACSSFKNGDRIYWDYKTTWEPYLCVSINGEGNYIAAKLEFSPAQTLARQEGDTWVLRDPPPNKALELQKCQRYFIPKNPEHMIAHYVNGTYFYIPYPSCLRAMPAAISPQIKIFNLGTWYPLTIVTMIHHTPYGGIIANFSDSNHKFAPTAGYSYLVKDFPALSAEL